MTTPNNERVLRTYEFTHDGLTHSSTGGTDAEAALAANTAYMTQYHS